MSNEHTHQGNTLSEHDDHEGGAFVRNLIYVMMSSIDDMDSTYSAIANECKKLGLEAKRANPKAGSGPVIRDIVQSIRDAEFLICDLTHERPNVYYELGFAHGVGNEINDILLIAREGTQLHFDVMPMRVQYYNSMDSLRVILARSLPEMMQNTRSE